MKQAVADVQNALPGVLTPGKGWSGRVFETGLKGMYQMLRGLGLEPGKEMLAAMQEADACGARIVYGDQEQAVTLARISASVNMLVCPPTSHHLAQGVDQHKIGQCRLQQPVMPRFLREGVQC